MKYNDERPAERASELDWSGWYNLYDLSALFLLIDFPIKYNFLFNQLEYTAGYWCTASKEKQWTEDKTVGEHCLTLAFY